MYVRLVRADLGPAPVGSHACILQCLLSSYVCITIYLTLSRGRAVTQSLAPSFSSPPSLPSLPSSNTPFLPPFLPPSRRTTP